MLEDTRTNATPKPEANCPIAKATAAMTAATDTYVHIGNILLSFLGYSDRLTNFAIQYRAAAVVMDQTATA